MTHELWAGLNAHIFSFLRSVTLAQLVAQQHEAMARAGDAAVLQDHRVAMPARPAESIVAL
jgi:DNA-binding IscR family transcriptional regulator